MKEKGGMKGRERNRDDEWWKMLDIGERAMGGWQSTVNRSVVAMGKNLLWRLLKQPKFARA